MGEEYSISNGLPVFSGAFPVLFISVDRRRVFMRP